MNAERSTALSAAEARDLLVRAVNEKGPDYVYQRQEPTGGCLYMKNGQPDCLIGHVLFYLDVPPLAFESLEGQGAKTVVEKFFPDTDPRVLVALGAAQSTQDNGGTWGQALEAAESSLRLSMAGV